MACVDPDRRLVYIYEIVSSSQGQKNNSNQYSMSQCFFYDLKKLENISLIRAFTAFEKIGDGVYQFYVQTFGYVGIVNSRLLIKVKQSEKTKQVFDSEADSTSGVTVQPNNHNKTKKSMFELVEAIKETNELSSQIERVRFIDGEWHVTSIKKNSQNHQTYIFMEKISTSNQQLQVQQLSLTEELIGFQDKNLTDIDSTEDSIYLVLPTEDYRSYKLPRVVRVWLGGLNLFEFDRKSREHLSRVVVSIKVLTPKTKVKFVRKANSFKIVCLKEIQVDKKGCQILILDHQMVTQKIIELPNFYVFGAQIITQDHILFKNPKKGSSRSDLSGGLFFFDLMTKKTFKIIGDDDTGEELQNENLSLRLFCGNRLFIIHEDSKATKGILNTPQISLYYSPPLW